MKIQPTQTYTKPPAHRQIRPGADTICFLTKPESTVIHFTGKDTPPPKKRWTRFFYSPFVRLASFVIARPRVKHRFFPKANRRYLEPQYFHLFEPRQTVSFKSLDGIPLRGHWMPSKKSKPSTATVILGHGYTADWRTMVGLGEVFRHAGYHVFLFDFRAHGQSQGKRTSFGYREGRDLAAAIEFVKTHYPEASQKLFYYGHSMGAASAMMMPQSLAKYPDALTKVTQRVDGFIFDAPYADASHFLIGKPSEKPSQPIKAGIARRLWIRILGPLKKRFQERIIEALCLNGKKFMHLETQLQEMKPGTIWGQHALAEKPILYLHGKADRTTSYEESLENYAAMGGKNRKNIRFISIPGLDHIGTDWEPAQDGEKFTSALRGGPRYTNTLLSFLQELTASQSKE